jgi:hypothetical protein
MPGEATMMLLARSLLCGLLVAAGGLPAAAQDASKKFANFLCGVDLVDDKGGYNINTTEFVVTPIDGGVVYTFESNKLCTNSQIGENIKIDCSARIPGWKGVAVDTKKRGLHRQRRTVRHRWSALGRHQQPAHRGRPRQRFPHLPGEVTARQPSASLRDKIFVRVARRPLRSGVLTSPGRPPRAGSPSAVSPRP